MNSWAGCAFPDGLLYDLTGDTWVRLEADGEVVIGMTDVAQSRCGRLVHVGWKMPGRFVERSRPLSVIESAKWVGPMRAPLSGVVVASNQATFAKDIAIANRDPYGAGWFYRLRAQDSMQIEALAGATVAFEHYKKVIDETKLRCFRCED